MTEILEVPGGFLLAVPASHAVWKVTLANKDVVRLIGTGTRGGGTTIPDGVPAITAAIDLPTGLAISRSGVVYVTDAGTSVLLAVGGDGLIRRVAGIGHPGLNKSTTARDAALNAPEGVAVGQDGAIFLADTGNNLIRSVGADGRISEVVGGGRSEPALSPRSPRRLTLSRPAGVAVDPTGTLWVADSGANRVLRVDSPYAEWVSVQGTFVDPYRISLGDRLVVSNQDGTVSSPSSGTSILQASMTDGGLGRRAILSQDGRIVRADRNHNRLVAARFPARPSVTTISPTAGPIEGGQALTIAGSGLATVTSVSIGSTIVRKPKFARQSESSITLATPPHSAGIATIRASGPLGSSTVGTGSIYRYGALPASGVSAPRLPNAQAVQAPMTPSYVGPLGVGTLLSGGSYHGLAISSNYSAVSWGTNTNGQLGDGGAINSSKLSPTPIPGMTNTASVAAGAVHSMALDFNGFVWTWGSNSYGQLGDGLQIDSSTPIEVQGLVGVTAIAAGGGFSLGLSYDGTVWAWGDNSYGQLGNPTVSAVNSVSTVPVQVQGLSGIAAITAGLRWGMAVDSSGVVWTWGDDEYGQLGRTAIAGNDPIPAAVPGLPRMTSVAGGNEHSVALSSTGSAWVWGGNYSHQLGDGTTTSRAIPQVVPGLGSVRGIAAGALSSLAVLWTGSVQSWGCGCYGSLGDGTGLDRSTPVYAQGIGNAALISSGPAAVTTYALTSNLGVSAWGDSSFGQLGIPGTSGSQAPTPLVGMSCPYPLGLSYSRPVAAGDRHVLSILSDGSVWAWGSNDEGQLGTGTQSDSSPGIAVAGLTSVVAVAAGSAHSLAVDSNGFVWTWGDNSRGQLGLGDEGAPVAIPTKVANLYRIREVAAGDDFSIAVGYDGSVWTWGANDRGQLGNGSTVDSLAPWPVLYGAVVNVVAGSDHALLLDSGGQVYAWGRNSEGQLGLGDTSDRLTPTHLALPAVDAIAAGGLSSSVLPFGTHIPVAWGWTYYGQAGTTSVPSVSSPHSVGSTQLADLVGGFSSFLGRTLSEGVIGWGYDGTGELANHAGISTASPVQALDASGSPIGSVASLATRGEHTIAELESGLMYEWGQLAQGIDSQPSFSPIVAPPAPGPKPPVKPKATTRAGSRPFVPPIIPLPPRPGSTCPFYSVDPIQVINARSRDTTPYLGVDSLTDLNLQSIVLRVGNDAWGHIHIARLNEHGWGGPSPADVTNPRWRSQQAVLGVSITGPAIQPTKDVNEAGSYDYNYYYIYTDPQGNQNRCTRLVVVQFRQNQREQQNGSPAKGIITAKDEGGWVVQPIGTWT